MFANFALPDLARVSRRTVLGGLVFGVIGLIACLALGAPLTGLGLCVGLGLGLFISRKGVEASGGSIRVRDVPGHGCVFTVQLPMST